MAEAPVLIIGGGPAGLTAALELTRFGERPTVLERTNAPGGIARTENYHGFHFDMGGHRFFTKLPRSSASGRRSLGADFLKRPRLAGSTTAGATSTTRCDPSRPWRGSGPWRPCASP